MAVYTKVTGYQVSNTANSATYTCTVSADASSYFGILNQTTCMAIRKASGYFKYWGWPRTWKSSWGSPSWYLSSGSVYGGRFGSLPGMLGDGGSNQRSYTWTETVSINRGNSRKGTTQVTVGVESTSSDSRFPSALITIPLSTTEIPKGYFTTGLSVSSDPGTTQGNRYIRISCSFYNPESFYRAILYDSNGVQLATSTGSSLEHTILITKDMYQTTKRFIVKLYGKDNTLYDTKEGTNTIEPSGAGVWAKLNSTATEINKEYFRNVTNKEVTEVWVYINGKWRKTQK